VGKGLVYLYRTGKVFGAMVGYDVLDNNVKIGGLPIGSYFVYQAAPGLHVFTASTESTSAATLQVEAGKTYYVQGTLGVGMFVGRPHLYIVRADEGAKAIPRLKRVRLSAGA
jgi:hypothetical protein